jgi:hypothetical protein
MTDNERIDKVLDALAKSQNGRLNVQEFLDKAKDEDRLSYQRIIPIIEDKGFAKRLPTLGNTCMILSAGLDIVNSGGYLTYLEKQWVASEEEAKEGKTTAELNEVNLQLNRFLLKYKWLPYFLSGAAIVISIFAIIISIVKS